MTEKLVQDELLDGHIAAFLFEWDLEQLIRVAHRPGYIRSHTQPVEVFVVKVAERLHNELLAELLMLVVLEVGVEDETDAPSLHNVVNQPDLHPVNTLRQTL